MTFSARCSQAANQVTHLINLAATPDLDNVARGLIPGYTGSFSADAADTANAIQAAITWITTNVPKDVNGIVLVTSGILMEHKPAADSRQSKLPALRPPSMR
jgi:hypothetical protein